MITEGRSINVTLIFSIERYDEVIEAYLSGLEALVASGPRTSPTWPAWRPSSSAGWTPRWTGASRRRPAGGGRTRPPGAAGPSAVAQARLAYQLFTGGSPARWEALAAKGARVQRPLWASTSTKNPAYPDLAYVDTLIGPDTVNTMPDGTIADFLDHGTVARTMDADVDEAPTGDRRVGRGPASTWRTWPRCSRPRAWPRSPSRSTSSMQSLTDKANTLAAG